MIARWDMDDMVGRVWMHGDVNLNGDGTYGR